MTVLQDILALSEQVATDALNGEVAAMFESAFVECHAVVLNENTECSPDTAATAISVMAFECSEAVIDEPVSLKDRADSVKIAESVDEQYQADVKLLESLTDVTIVALNTILSESFEAAVERILKSDRKLRMKDKDGKPYKTRRRAAEAAVGASMRAVFGKKGMIRKAQAGKKG